MSRIFLVLLSLYFVLLSSSSYAQQKEVNIYSVENVATSVSGKSPSDAKNLAVATARRDAFLILLTRLEIDLAMANIVTNDEISDMVMSEQVDGEKIAGNSYSASFNILFAKDFVDHILGKKNLKTAVQKKRENVLLIPVKRSLDGQSNLLWEDSNDWKMAIVKNVDTRKIASDIKFEIPDADIENLSVISKDNVESISIGAFAPMLERYNATKVYILFFSQNAAENKVVIDIAAMDRVQKKQFRLSFSNASSSSYDVILSKVANRVVDYIFSLKRAEQNAESTPIKIEIRFDNLKNWLVAKAKIENSGIVTDVLVDSISRDYAVMIMNYSNAQVTVKEAFAKIGLNLEQKAENSYVISY